MRQVKLEDMVRGWVVGNFDPSIYKTSGVEFAVQQFKAGDHEAWHYHKIATEVTVIVSGKAEMNGKELNAGDVVMLEPGEGTDFRVIEDTTTAVVKVPGVLNDKYTE